VHTSLAVFILHAPSEISEVVGDVISANRSNFFILTIRIIERYYMYDIDILYCIGFFSIKAIMIK
jgi:hypothetical protein